MQPHYRILCRSSSTAVRRQIPVERPANNKVLFPGGLETWQPWLDTVTATWHILRCRPAWNRAGQQDAQDWFDCEILDCRAMWFAQCVENKDMAQAFLVPDCSSDKDLWLMESMQEGFSHLLHDWSKEVPDLAKIFEARHIAMKHILANTFVHYHCHEYIWNAMYWLWFLWQWNVWNGYVWNGFIWNGYVVGWVWNCFIWNRYVWNSIFFWTCILPVVEFEAVAVVSRIGNL